MLRLAVLPLLVLAAPGSASFLVRRDDSNPLLTRLDEAFPPFDAVRASHVVPAIKALVVEADEERRALEAAVSKPDFRPDAATLLRPYRLLGDRLSRAYSIASHLKTVADSPELRAAIETVQPAVINSSTLVDQSKPLYRAFKALQDDPTALAKLTGPQKRLVDMVLKGFVLSGVSLEGAEQEEFNNITQRLSALSSSYEENVLDATKSWKKWITSKDALKGLPDVPLQLAAEAAAKEVPPPGLSAGNGTLYLLTLDGPTAGALLTYAEDAGLRREVYIASSTEASELLQPDNAPVAREILQLRQRKANLLGFANFAELSMQRKMATLETANKLLEDLRVLARPGATSDLQDLQQFAQAHGYEGDLKQWDLSFWSKKQMKDLYNFDSEELRPYFPLDRCLDGLFGLVHKMYKIEFRKSDAPKWHKDVQVFALLRDGAEVAHFYLDLYARAADKRSGAWQVGLQDYDGERGRKPIAAIVANLRPPVAGKPALLSYGELHTLFHEFGHSLQTMLTTQKEPSLAGTEGVEWDAVELPSQFMEYWLDEVDWVVQSIGRHYETGQPLPLEKFQMLKAAQKYHPAMSMLGQLHLSILDLDLHTNPLAPGETLQAREAKIGRERQTKLLAPLPEDRFLCHFSHIFAGGYAAGYYSYKWADVLSADAFSRFEESGATMNTTQGLTMLAKIGGEFAGTVLAEGGGRKAEDIFETFRGRPPSPKALIHYAFRDVYDKKK